jgi:hypothetical protein
MCADTFLEQSYNFQQIWFRSKLFWIFTISKLSTFQCLLSRLYESVIFHTIESFYWLSHCYRWVQKWWIFINLVTESKLTLLPLLPFLQ